MDENSEMFWGVLERFGQLLRAMNIDQSIKKFITEGEAIVTC